ncbi:FAD-dependent oxidoreductase, partial [Halovivax sp.]|uniref:FAD-dependent oxidoreductase n=1 Tax=Halovivax sp. TaxID=1935978 RepID=UPI0031B8591D
QYFLSTDVELSRGHQVYADAPWALTSISQRQFWTDDDLDERGPAEVEGVLSVIASDWDTPGILYGKPARKCTRAEIETEIWEQLKLSLNATETRLTDELLVDWFLDPAIVETDGGVENRSPLLINTVGSLRNRPPADVAVANLTLASDYVRTNADLASMESANEAGRRAANAICERRGVRGPEARIWDLEEPAVFEPFKRQDRVRYRLGLPHPAAVTQSLRTVRRRLAGSA